MPLRPSSPSHLSVRAPLASSPPCFPTPPSPLRYPSLPQVNAGPEVAGWHVLPFGLHHSRVPQARQLLRCCDPVIIFHRASEMALVCDQGTVFFEAPTEVSEGCGEDGELGGRSECV